MVLLPGFDSFLSVQWSVLCWRLRVDPLKIFSALSVHLSPLWCLRCKSSHLPSAPLDPQLSLRSSGSRAPPACSPALPGLKTLPGQKLEQSQDLACFPSPRDHYPMLPYSSILKIIFHVFCLLFLVLLSGQIKSSHAILAWIEM